MFIGSGDDHGDIVTTTLQQASEAARASTWAGRLRTTVEDITSDDEDDTEPGLRDTGHQAGANPQTAREQEPDEDYDEAFWNEYVDECLAAAEREGRDDDNSDVGLSAWDQLGVEFEAENRPTCAYMTTIMEAQPLMHYAHR